MVDGAASMGGDWGTFWAAFGVVVAILAAWFGFALHFANNLRDPEDCARQRQRYLQALKPGAWDRFRDALETLLRRIDRFYGYADEDGKTGHFWRPWGRSIQIAVVYPVFLLLLGYAWNGRGDLAGFSLFDPKAAFGWRLVPLGWAAALALALALASI